MTNFNTCDLILYIKLMEIILSHYDFSYDPVTTISEDQATGKTAEIFLGSENEIFFCFSKFFTLTSLYVILKLP